MQSMQSRSQEWLQATLKSHMSPLKSSGLPVGSKVRHNSLSHRVFCVAPRRRYESCRLSGAVVQVALLREWIDSRLAFRN
jgi:hypothetical protein